MLAYMVVICLVLIKDFVLVSKMDPLSKAENMVLQESGAL